MIGREGIGVVGLDDIGELDFRFGISTNSPQFVATNEA